MPAPVLAVAHTGGAPCLAGDRQDFRLPVRFAEEREPVRPGRILLAPPDRHMLVVSAAGQPCMN
jgi:two-component system chemotaxis response regulator CheB